VTIVFELVLEKVAVLIRVISAIFNSWEIVKGTPIQPALFVESLCIKERGKLRKIKDECSVVQLVLAFHVEEGHIV